jgi:D-alanyl-D-alanine dipeptidase
MEKMGDIGATVVPDLAPGINLSPRSEACGGLDPGDKHRDHKQSPAEPAPCGARWRARAVAATMALALAAMGAPEARAQWPHDAFNDKPATKPSIRPKTPPAPEPAKDKETTALPEPLVYLRDIDATILQDMRYAGADNFTGRPVQGYGAPECVLLRETAEALARVQQALAPRKLSLKVYDCYRPRRAVRDFVEWIKTDGSGDDPLLKRFHPHIERNQLIALGYVAAVSRHSLGDTVDLTLVEMSAKAAAPFRRDTPYGACTGPAKERAPDSSVDMGTGYDCFDALSHTNAAAISPAQRAWRELLIEVMAAQGFRNYAKEWWHFTLTRTQPGRSFDVTIRPRKR